MESGEGAEEKEQLQLQQATEALKKSAPEGAEKLPKRKMKTPYQLEILEKTYAAETYPTETLRAELSVKTGLSDRQLQIWFCHRRLKDRKFPPTKKRRREEEPLPLTPPPPVFPSQNDRLSSESGGVGLSSSPFSGGLGSNGESRRSVSRTAPAVSRIGADMSAIGRRCYDLGFPPSAPTQPTMAEMRIFASVESQLGEPLRHDGPVLGVEFDPLPPGAFGAPIAAMPVQQRQPMRPNAGNIFERYNTQPMKAATFLSTADHLLASSSGGKRKLTASVPHMGHPRMGHRTLHEYQFLPEQPSVRSETYDRVSQAHYYDSVDGSNAKVASLPKKLHGNEQETPSYTFQDQISSAHLLSQQGRQHNFPSISMDSDDPPCCNTLPIPATDSQFGMHLIAGIENQYVSSDRRSAQDDDFSRLERKHKSDEARIAKEVEVHEKRIRKELEKQDTLRRKTEEQMRREMERLDRERRKEEERMLREKLREEERLQREQRRENERREKFLLKESQRAEKLRQKEELRREKEAVRQKAATERATARRIAREYTELIEDERLELMEIAAMNKGLSSIFGLDSDTLQQLDSFRSMLQAFPPSSLELRRPFGVQPWVDSDENIANVLMVWKFLITFADVLGLWSFTLDEFVQSLHDYDSRLLGEIHVSLLKSIIKDIEDVARAPAITVSASQNSSANPGAGHLQIVEGAYAWGFNIRSWQRHLNYLTWSEILRQFALSAGFGPQLKKKNVERTYFQDENEGIDGVDVISTLLNGSAIENAVAIMHERGYTHRRRSRHRLTPGTVKFAAFHVLSLEGSRGLTILEVADKIQRSGLRDLTTSKTPEASIAAALSRDTKLFERTAPSTYCVRSPFRKDPAEADALLSAAREKVHIFQSALSDSEEAEKDTEDVNGTERYANSEADAGVDPEVDDIGIDPNLAKNDPLRSNLKDPRTLNSIGKVKGVREIGATPQTSIRNVEKVCLIPSSENAKTVGSGASEFAETNSKFLEAVNVTMEETEIDESNFGEPWVQGLSEGDYSELSVEERLCALVALIGVAIEGNSIQVVLEERLEAATALKRQMWAEAQLDKRRFREEYSSRLQGTFGGYKAEIVQMNGAREGSQTPHGNVDKANDGNLEAINNEQFLEQNQINMGYMPMGQQLTNTDDLSIQQCGYAAERSRSQLKSFIGHKAELLYVYRSLPLGQDRRRNRYWLFSTSSSPNDPGSGRIFLESKDGHWRLIDSEEAFDTVVAALDNRGIRESHLYSMLQRIETTYKEAIKRRKNVINSTKSFEDHSQPGASRMMSSSGCSMEIDSPSSTLCRLTPDDSKNSTFLKIELGSNQIEKNSALVRYQGFLSWIWKECYNSHILCAMKYGKKRCPELLHSCGSCFQSFLAEERHCSSCHKTFKTFQNSYALFSEHVALCEKKRKLDTDWKLQISDSTLPMGIRLLKALLSLIEAAIPAEALQAFWTDSYRKSWAVKLHSSASAEELFQVLTLLEHAVKPNFLSSNFETTAERLSSSQGVASTISAQSGVVPVLPWVPDTSAAVALRLLDLDFSISYMLNQKLESQKQKEGYHIRLPSHSTVVNMQEVDPMGTHDQVDYLTGRLDSGSRQRGRGRGSRGRGGRGRARGRGLSGGANSSIANFMTENGVFQKATRKFTRRGRTRGRGERRRGRQTVRPRQRSDSRGPTIDKRSLLGSLIFETSSPKQATEDSPQSSGEEWGIARVRKPYVEDDNITRGSESYDNGHYDDDSPRAYDYGKSIGSTEDVSEEDGGDMEMDDDVEEDDLDAYMDDGVDDTQDNPDDIEDGKGNRDEDEGTTSYSSHYSD